MSLLDPTPTVIQSCHSPQFDITYPGNLFQQRYINIVSSSDPFCLSHYIIVPPKKFVDLINKAAIEQFDGIRLGHFRIAPPPPHIVKFRTIKCIWNFLGKSYILTAPKL